MANCRHKRKLHNLENKTRNKVDENKGKDVAELKSYKTGTHCRLRRSPPINSTAKRKMSKENLEAILEPSSRFDVLMNLHDLNDSHDNDHEKKGDLYQEDEMEDEDDSVEEEIVPEGNDLMHTLSTKDDSCLDGRSDLEDPLDGWMTTSDDENNEKKPGRPKGSKKIINQSSDKEPRRLARSQRAPSSKV
ncbi:OLC1v1036206C1 [Oldenlandia corymbosa var. corymbosa]|uniref:OLC1v1036206C1 n=1 Tax=Oldenlandia corymbosa var. corymbosa TaxID=529605 RepID=A0AAV1CY04_OLDCO|nr:OLC1v1036206C1 [Oldenlandia corymbosa var. corymbosa]